MTCPVCGEKAGVIDVVSEIDCTYRRRKCVKCGYSFYTEEVEIGKKPPEGFFKKRRGER